MQRILKTILSALAFAGLTINAQAYTINVAESQNCIVSVSPEQSSYEAGDQITVTIISNTGSTFESFELYYECTEAEWWEANSSTAKGRESRGPRRASSFSYRLESFYFNDEYDDEYEEVTEGVEYTFTMPGRNVEIEAIFTSNTTEYPVTVTQTSNGTTTVSHSSATAGTTVTITTTALAGSMLDDLKVYERKSSGNMILEDEMTYTKTDETHFTFTMPSNPVRVEATYKKVISLLELQDQSSNSSLLSEYSNIEVNVQLTGRTLYKDGSWNTLCLPFAVSDFEGTPLEGAVVKTLTSATLSNDTLTMSFSSDLTSIEAGKPYIVKWEPGEDIVNPRFNTVTIINQAPTDVTSGAISFHGIFSPYIIGADGNSSIICIGSNNRLYWPNTSMTIGSFRAYFTVGDVSGESPSGIRAFKLDFSDSATGIRDISETGLNGQDSNWYTLDGRRLINEPTTRGVYIFNGKKIMIK